MPFAKIVSGLEAVDKFYSGYGELRPQGKFIDPGALEEGGKRWSLGRATNVFIGQRREQTQRRDESNEEKRQDRQPIRAA